MRSVDGLRDAAQHWFLVISEELLYMHTKALITAFDRYMKRKLDDHLGRHVPPRVLPVSTLPPGDFEFLFDREYSKIGELLKPGQRHRDEARGRIRSLLAMEGLVADEVRLARRILIALKEPSVPANDQLPYFQDC